jgi:hypothetical protein
MQARLLMHALYFMPIGPNTHIAELLETAAHELEELKRSDSITLQLRPLQAWALLGNLQLALASERNKGVTARIGRSIAKQLERVVANTPALKEVARRGWKGQIGEWLH